MTEHGAYCAISDHESSSNMCKTKYFPFIEYLGGYVNQLKVNQESMSRNRYKTSSPNGNDRSAQGQLDSFDIKIFGIVLK